MQRLAPFLATTSALVYMAIMARTMPDRILQEPDDSEPGEHKVKLLPGDPAHQLQIRGIVTHGNTEFKAIRVGMTFNQVRSILHVDAVTNEKRAHEITSAGESRVSFVSSDNSAIEVLLRNGIVAEKHHLSPEMREFTEQQRHVDEYP